MITLSDNFGLIANAFSTTPSVVYDNAHFGSLYSSTLTNKGTLNDTEANGKRLQGHFH